MGTLKVGYVGAGQFSNMCMFPQLSQHDIALVALCDLDEDKAKEVAARYGFAKTYASVDTMLDNEELDAVFCVGGPKVHYLVGRQVLERGLPLYIQKSPAVTAADTRELAKLAADHATICHVGFNIRSAAAVAKARQIIDSPEFGRPTLGIFRYGFVSGATVEDAVMDQHCHLYDTARYLMGDIEELQVFRGGLEGVRHYTVNARFASGAVGTLNFTSEQGGREFMYLEVTGEGGQMITSHQFDLRYQRAATAPNDLGSEIVVLEPGLGLFGSEGALQWMGYTPDVANFLAAVRGEAEDIAPIASTIETMEVCEEVSRQFAAAGSTQ